MGFSFSFPFGDMVLRVSGLYTSTGGFVSARASKMEVVGDSTF